MNDSTEKEQEITTELSYSAIPDPVGEWVRWYLDTSLKQGQTSLIGLFQGMFEKNILTFNPGWDENACKKEAFDDVREIQRQLKSKGIRLDSEADENSTGPASCIVTDPDGNTILFDQHV